MAGLAAEGGPAVAPRLGSRRTCVTTRSRKWYICSPCRVTLAPSRCPGRTLYMALARFTRVSAAVWPVTSSRMNAAGTALSSPEDACLVVTCTDSALSLGTACVLVYCILAIRSGRTTMLYHSLSRQRDMPPAAPRRERRASGPARGGVNLSGHV